MLNLLDKALLGIGLVEQAELGRGAHRPAGRLALGIALEEEAERELAVIRLLGHGQDLPGQVAHYAGLATQPRLLHLLELGEVLDDQLECGLGSAVIITFDYFSQNIRNYFFFKIRRSASYYSKALFCNQPLYY